MSFIKKINRGLLCFVVVILFVLAYLISVSVSRNAEKPAIKSAISDFMDTYYQYTMLPEKYRAVGATMPEEEFKSYLNKMQTDIEKFFETKEYATYTKNKLTQVLSNQSQAGSIIVKNEYKITRYDFSYTDHIVTVNILSTVSSENIGKQRNQNSTTVNDTVSLKLTGGKWNILSANITDNSNQEPSYLERKY